MLLGKSTAAAALLVSMFAPAAASAQYGDTGDSERPTIHVFGQFGGASALKDMNLAGSATLKNTWVAGGGVGLQITPGFALRAGLEFSPAEGEGATNPVLGQMLNRMYYGVDLQARYISERGLAPYFVLGLSGISIENADDSDFESFSGFAAKGGVGLEYIPKAGNLSYSGQLTSYLYKYDADNFNRWQSDLMYTVGLKYRITR